MVMAPRAGHVAAAAVVTAIARVVTVASALIVAALIAALIVPPLILAHGIGQGGRCAEQGERKRPDE